MKLYEDRIASNGVTCLKTIEIETERSKQPPPHPNTRERAHNMVIL
jgi:hypothetical protein